MVKAAVKLWDWVQYRKTTCDIEDIVFPRSYFIIQSVIVHAHVFLLCFFYQFIKYITTRTHELLTSAVVVFFIEFLQSLNRFSYQCIFIYSVTIFVQEKNDPDHVMRSRKKIFARLDRFTRNTYRLRMLIATWRILFSKHVIQTKLVEHVVLWTTWGGLWVVRVGCSITAQQVAFKKLSN